MNTLQTILDEYRRKNETWEKERDYLRNRIAMREKQIERLERREHLNWSNVPSIIAEIIKPICAEIIKPICDEIVKHYPGVHYKDDIMAFGICSRKPVGFYEDDGNKLFAWIEFTNQIKYEDDDYTKVKSVKLFVTDIYTDTGRFGYGTIGEMNGMNHPSIPVPDDADIQWFIDFIEENKRKNEAEQVEIGKETG